VLLHLGEKTVQFTQGRRIFHRDVERDQFQYANAHCLSSYYSVFVARLAIMNFTMSMKI
ncbi:hypothetical protein GBA52_028967, partial [Prunus armeniaca]